MYYGRKKGIIIAIVIVVLVIVLGVVGALLYLNTDMFKPNKTLFWKYAGGLIDENEKITLSQLTDVMKMMEQKPYTIEGELELESDDENLDEVLNLIKLNVSSQNDKVNQYHHTNAAIEVGNEALFELDYLNSQNVYALKSDDIVTVFLGIRNENLKVLAQKLGLQNTTDIPDTIEVEENDMSELYDISEEDLTHILDTYGPLIVDSISDSNYSKQTQAVLEKNGKSYTTTSYRLDLTGQEQKELIIKVLREIQTDSVTLNLISSKAKLLGLDDETIEINTITNKIEDLITQLQDVELEDTSIVVYNYNGKNIATEIIIKNIQKLTIYKEIGKVSIKSEDLTGESTSSKTVVDINYGLTSTQTSLSLSISVDDEELYSISCNNNGSAAQGNLETEIVATGNYNGSEVIVSYNQTLKFVDSIPNMIKIDNTNCAIINDYTKEQIEGLIQAISERIQVVILEKSQILSNLFANQVAVERAQQNINEYQSSNDVLINGQRSDQNTNVSAQSVETFNSQYSQYMGTNITGKMVSILKNTIANNNLDSNRKIEFFVNGNTVDGAGVTINMGDTATYTVTAQYDNEGYINKIMANINE